MNNADYIYTRLTHRTRQRVYALSTPILLDDFEEVKEVLISSTLGLGSPSTHVLPIRRQGVQWRPILILDSLAYDEGKDAEVDALLLETLGYRRRQPIEATLGSSRNYSAKISRRQSLPRPRALGAVLNWMRQPKVNLGSQVRV